jgi:hypothetical protein
MARPLFRAAFDVLDKLPEDTRSTLAQRVYEGAYERFLAAEKTGDGPSKTAPAEPDNGPSNTFAVKSSRPRPPK